MISLGLLGENISHSRSKEMYEIILKRPVNYSLIDIDSSERLPDLDYLFEKYNLLGMSVTYPYKKHYLNNVVVEDEYVKSIGAVNCIHKIHNSYYATNTDFLAAKYLLENIYLEKYDNFIILGSGNMARVFEVLFESLEIDYISYSRKTNGDLNLVNLNIKKSFKDSRKSLIINTCSRDFIFKPRDELECGFWDMNYSFSPHCDLKNKGMVYFDGLDLLREQARFALLFWGIEY